jgi:hypothetical protein
VDGLNVCGIIATTWFAVSITRRFVTLYMFVTYIQFNTGKKLPDTITYVSQVSNVISSHVGLENEKIVRNAA